MKQELQRGLELLQSRKLKEAVEVFEAVLYEDPSDTDALCNIGIAFTELGENDKAVKALTYCLKLDPDSSDALEAMGCAYLRLERFTEARTFLERALARSPDNPSVLRNLGVLYSKTGDADRCYSCLKRSSEINPHDFLTQYALASAHAYFRKYDESRSILERLVVNSDTPEDIRTLAEADLRRLEKLV